MGLRMNFSIKQNRRHCEPEGRSNLLHVAQIVSSHRMLLAMTVVVLSGRRDLNPGPLAPKASALAGLRYAPILGGECSFQAVHQAALGTSGDFV